MSPCLRSCVYLCLQRLDRESRVWSSLSHPNIVPFLGMCNDAERPQIPCMISPYYPNGNINRYIKIRPDTDRFLLVRFALFLEVPDELY